MASWCHSGSMAEEERCQKSKYVSVTQPTQLAPSKKRATQAQAALFVFLNSLTSFESIVRAECDSTTFGGGGYGVKTLNRRAVLQQGVFGNNYQTVRALEQKVVRRSARSKGLPENSRRPAQLSAWKSRAKALELSSWPVAALVRSRQFNWRPSLNTRSFRKSPTSLRPT
jgi:hypothetical protein